jgi:hypothetical protein
VAFEILGRKLTRSSKAPEQGLPSEIEAELERRVCKMGERLFEQGPGALSKIRASRKKYRGRVVPELKAMHQSQVTLSALGFGKQQVNEGANQSSNDFTRCRIRPGPHGLEVLLVALHERFEPAFHDGCDKVSFGLEVILQRTDGESRSRLNRSHRHAAHPVPREEFFRAVE